MDSLVHTLLSNALAATFMALIAVALARMCRRPALTHSVWLLVMLKFVTPPFVTVSLPVASLIPPIESSRDRMPLNRDLGLITGSEPLPHFHADNAWPGIDQLSSEDSTVFAQTERDFRRADVPLSGPLAVERTHLPSGPKYGWSWEAPVFVLILAGALGWWIRATRPGLSDFSTSLMTCSRRWRSGNCIVINSPGEWV